MPRIARHVGPVTLAEQLVAWAMYRRGESVDTITNRINRRKPDTRALLFGPQT